ncbi:putative amp dependent CoA ligase [Xylaria grammica]|nr:putative amp dependent CoA ligase [Xylaria grammica]
MPSSEAADRGGEQRRNTDFNGTAEPSVRECNIGQLLDRASSKHPGKLALVSRWQGQRLSYEQLQTSCHAVARDLISSGVRPGDRVMVLAGNSVQFVQLFLAVGAIGAIFSVLNPASTTEEVMSAIELLEPKCIFIADRVGYRQNATLLGTLQKQSTSLWKLVVLSEGASLRESIAMHGGTCPRTIERELSDDATGWATADPNKALCIQFTSGTTGPKKAAILSHRNLITNALGVGDRLQYTSTDIVCCCAPLFHCFALVCGIISSISFCSTLVLPSDVFIAEDSLEAISAERCTVIHAVPTMFRAMVDHPDAEKHLIVDTLRTGIVAGSKLSRSFVSEVIPNMRIKSLAYGYGMTELSCIVFLTDPSRTCLLHNHHSVGTALPQAAVRVVNDDMVTLPSGSSGELLVSGSFVFLGYYKNSKATEKTRITDSEGITWVKTGDTVCLDTQGHCTITGRVKDMIKRGGENIFPGDIEDVLQQHPRIDIAAVVGISDEKWGERVVAFIQCYQMRGSKGLPNPKELKVWLRGRLAPHKFPAQFYFLGEGEGVPASLPRNFSGKLLKSELQRIAERLTAES